MKQDSKGFLFMRLFFAITCSILFPFTIMGSHQAHAKDLLYTCPDINNKSKQTLGQIYQGYDGWFFKDIDFKQNYLLAPDTLSYLKRFNDALADKGVKLIFSPIVPKPLMAYEAVTDEDRIKLNYDYDDVSQSYNHYIDQLRDIGITTPNLLKPIEDYDGSDMSDLTFKIDHHWTSKGAKKTAEAIANIIKSDPLYNDLPKVESTYVQIDEPFVSPSTMHIEVRSLCTSKIPNEKLDLYNFTVVTQNDADALFGDNDAGNPIALIGTSFSAVSKFSFRDFLEYFSKLGVFNYSIAGGQLYVALTSYLSSPYFINERPKYLVWELPAKYDQNIFHASHMRQIIPSVYGACHNDKILKESKISLKEYDQKSQKLFDDLDELNIHGNTYYLHINSDNNAFKKFSLDIEYSDGDGEWFNIDRGDRYKNYGDFYVELSNDIKTDLSYINLTNIEGLETNITATICKK